MAEGDDASEGEGHSDEQPSGSEAPERSMAPSPSDRSPPGGERLDLDDGQPTGLTERLRGAIVHFARTDQGLVAFLREMIVSVLVVVAIGMLLFAVSGVWPPMVAVESGSMEPNLYRGDLVVVMEEQRFAPEYAVGGSGVVPMDVAEDHHYVQFGGNGDVIVYKPYGNDQQTPVIHRAHFYVEKGENWYDRADPAYVEADSCEELRYCPAPYAGFITKGDNDVSNDYYDQARGISTPVKSEWIKGTAEVRIPWLGWVRLAVSDTKLPGVSSGIEMSQGTAIPG